MNQGFIYLPYIMDQTVSVVNCGNFNPSSTIKSRYTLTNINSNNYYGIKIEDELLINRRNKIEKIRNKIKIKHYDNKRIFNRI
jgi:hypothetical protein